MAERTGATGRAIEVLALQALSLRASGKGGQALVALVQALALAEPEGYVRTFIDQGAPMRQLLQEVVAHGQPTDYGDRLLATLETELQVVRHRSEKGPLTVHRPLAEGWVDPLSEREREVLRMLPTHLSRKETADELSIPVNTVRFHVKNIYRVLGRINSLHGDCRGDTGTALCPGIPAQAIRLGGGVRSRGLRSGRDHRGIPDLRRLDTRTSLLQPPACTCQLSVLS
jgi:LuxR family maltose regulon positive regulatory protein